MGRASYAADARLIEVAARFGAGSAPYRYLLATFADNGTGRLLSWAEAGTLLTRLESQQHTVRPHELPSADHLVHMAITAAQSAATTVLAKHCADPAAAHDDLYAELDRELLAAFRILHREWRRHGGR